MSLVKIFPAVPAKIHTTPEVKEFEAAIALGAGRKVVWQTPHGECVAKIKHDFRGMDSKLHYEIQGRKVSVPELIEKLAASGVEYVVLEPLTASDYVYI